MATPPEDVEVAEDASVGWLFGGLKADEWSDEDAQGEGRGFRGDIIEADVDRDAIVPPA